MQKNIKPGFHGQGADNLVTRVCDVRVSEMGNRLEGVGTGSKKGCNCFPTVHNPTHNHTHVNFNYW